MIGYIQVLGSEHNIIVYHLKIHISRAHEMIYNLKQISTSL